MKLIKIVLPFIKNKKVLILVYILLSCLGSIIGIFIPIISANFIDTLIMSPSLNSIFSFTKTLIIVSVSQLLITYLNSLLLAKLQLNISFQFNQSIMKNIHMSSILEIEQIDPVYLNQRVYNDCNTITSLFLSFINGIIINLLIICVCMYVLFTLSHQIFVLMFGLIICYVLIYFSLRNPVFKVKMKLKEENAKYVSTLQSQISYIRFLRIFNLYERFYKKIKEVFRAYLKSSVLNVKVNFLFQSSETIITLISQIFLFLYGGTQIVIGKLSIGSYTILSTYFNSLIKSIKYFLQISNDYIDALASIERIKRVTKFTKDDENGIVLEHINSITLNDISFSFSDKLIINHLSAELKKGKIYQIVGRNGSGKTTLTNLLMNLYPNRYSGTILYNGININKLQTNEIRQKKISYIGQDDFLIEDTVLNNLFICDFSKKEEELYELFKKFGLVNNQSEFEYLLKKPINETNLSGGEIKKICIIRGLIKDSEILIMDEPTNSLDLNMKRLMKDLLKKYKNNKIIIIVSHEIIDDVTDETIHLSS